MLNQVKGTVREAKGRLKQAAGDLADDSSLRAEGAVEATAGRTQRGLDKAVEPLRRLARRTPVRVLAVTVFVGLLLGHRRRC